MLEGLFSTPTRPLLPEAETIGLGCDRKAYLVPRAVANAAGDQGFGPRHEAAPPDLLPSRHLQAEPWSDRTPCIYGALSQPLLALDRSGEGPSKRHRFGLTFF